MRLASIHITEQALTEAIKSSGINIQDSEIKKLISACSRNQITHRKISISSDRVEKKAKMIVSSDKGDAQLFSQLLQTIRKGLKHRGIVQIKESSRDWLILKETCKLANEFCESFELDKRDGYIEFIRIALSKMTKFSINKFSYMCQGISEAYEAKLEIQADTNTDYTNRLYMYYNQRVLDRTGLAFNYKEQPEKYVFFVKSASICKKLGVKPEDFIDAQLDSFIFKENIPDPAQLVNQKAEDRVVAFMYKKGVKVDNQSTNINFSKIKKAKKRC